MYFVYILVSIPDTHRHYVGLTTDLERRLSQHNSGDGIYTRRFAPWRLEAYIAFQSKQTALRFERYLKEGSGHAFLKRHLIS